MGYCPGMIGLGTADGRWRLEGQLDGTVRIYRRWGQRSTWRYTCRTLAEIEGRLRALGYDLADLVDL
jgi:hypothetical protein